MALLNGTSLRPLPAVESNSAGMRYFHIYENDQLDEQLLASWFRPAAKLPGEHCF